MRDKVIDIRPPVNNCDRKKGSTCNKKRGYAGAIKTFAIILFMSVAVYSYIYYTSHHTEVVIYPNSQEFATQKDILSRVEGSLGEEEVRGIILSTEISDSAVVIAEGRELVEEKAQGMLTVCQDYTQTGYPYREGTRFLAEEGVIFEAQERFTVPSLSQGGCTEVNVIATEAGSKHNIDSETRLTLPGLSKTDVANNVWGENLSLTTKGIKEEMPYIDEEDKQKTEATITEKLLQEGEQALHEKYSDKYYINDYIIETEEYSIIETEEENAFDLQIKATIMAYAIEKKYINDYVDYIIPNGKTYEEETKKIEYTFSEVDFNEKTATISLVFSAIIYEKIDKEGLKRSLASKSFEQARQHIMQEIDTQRIGVYNRPFGLNKVFSDFNRIKIILKFDKN